MDQILLTYTQLFRLFDSLAIGAILLSPDFNLMGLNRSAELMTGASAAEAKGKPCRQVLAQGWCDGACRFESLEPGHRLSADKEACIAGLDPDGRNLTRMLLPLQPQKGALTGWLEIFQDHSAFKDLLKRIRYEDQRLKMILDNLDIGVMTVDRGEHVTFFNTTAETITGYSREDILGKSISLLFQEREAQNNHRLNETIRDGEPRSSQETLLTTRGGDTLPVRAEYMALKNKEGKIVGGLATISDLSLFHQLNRAIQDRYTFYDMVGRSPAMKRLFEIIPVVAVSDATVLIEGATGTGKDLVANVIHNASHRADRPLIKVNCAALPDNLLESEMFGYVKGAFTGADRDKPGRFQDADGGSIFLDEIGDMPLQLQAKLLRVLEDREFYPLGSRKTVKVDIRIISATNAGLETLVKEKRFREDLYYRLNVMRLEVPPLCERRDDLPLLISHLLKKLAAGRFRKPPEISEDAMAVLLNHNYPGNIRELENIIEHALIISRGEPIRKSHLPFSLQQQVDPCRVENVPESPRLNEGVESGEKTLILAALRKHHWQRGEAAGELAIDRTTLWRKMKKYGLSPE
ncbi:MAG: sigma 54-interacting transcriptional regulator [Desulfobacterales bacterium]|jgi:PAS domain S-box-containing protein|nr:sigma 54-interacting transcriptional regulator [Desulfobacterales bacterium]